MKEARIYNNCWRGQEISTEGIARGYIDYRCLANCVEHMILNNNIINIEPDWWQLYSGTDKKYYDNEGNEISEDEYFDSFEDSGDYDCLEVFQYYIIPEYSAEFLTEYTDEIIYYNDKLDVYLWGITHFDTSWDYVLTDIKIDKEYYNE
jgi:hypothetical protein